MDTNQFLIELQAKLNETKSETNINTDLDTIEKAIEKLKVQAEIDPNSVKNIAQQLSNILNQKIVVNNIQIEPNNAIKDSQQVGQKIGGAINQSVSSSLKSIKNDITNTLKTMPRLNATDIIKEMNLNRSSVETDISNQVKLLATEINNLGREAAKTNSDSAWEQLISKCTELGKILDTFGKTRSFPGMEDIKKFADYFNGKTISVGYKNSGLSGTDFTTKQLNKDLKDLTVKFDSAKQGAIELDTIWEEMCNTTGRMDLRNVTTAQDQIQTVISELLKAQSILNGEKGLVAHPNTHGDITKYIDDVKRTSDTVINLQNEMSSLIQKKSQESTASANTVVQNEERKQQALLNTAKIQQQLKENGNIIQQTDFATSFNTKDEAEKYFNSLSKIVSIQGKLGKNKSLESFIVEIKNAKGAVEKLTYKYNELTGAFEYSGGSINNNGIQKQIDAINIKASRLQDTFESLKSKYSDLNASNPIKEQSHITELENQYKKVEQAIKSVKASDSATFSSMVSNAESEIKVLQRMGEEFKRAETISMHMNGSDISSGLAQAQERFQKLRVNSAGFEQMTETIQKLDAAIAAVGNKSSLKTFVNQLKVAESQLGRVKAETKAITQANKIQLSIETGGYESKVDSLIARTRQWTDANGNARISTDNLSLAFDKLLSASNAFSDNKTIANQQALIKAENELNIEIEKVTNSVRKRNAEFAKDATISSLHNQIQKFYDNNGAAHRKWGAQLKQMLSETASGAELTKERVAEIKTAFNGVASAAQQAGKIGKTWFQSFKDAAKFLTYWTSPTFITMKTIAEIKQGINTVKELDTALVDLKKTTTMTGNELENFYYDSNKVAKQMGVTTKEIINQAAEFSRLGYSSKQAATEMAKYSSWFKTISPGMSIEKAGDTLTSVMKAFKYDVQDVEKIMSMINTVGNNFAVSNADISEILTRSSSAMMEANNSLADTIALGTAATEITRDAASVGNALKTISMRIRGRQNIASI